MHEIVEVCPHHLGSKDAIWRGALLNSAGEIFAIGGSTPALLPDTLILWQEIFFWLPGNPCIYQRFTEQRTAAARSAAYKIRSMWLHVPFSLSMKKIIVFRLNIVVPVHCCFLSNCVRSNGQSGTRTAVDRPGK